MFRRNIKLAWHFYRQQRQQPRQLLQGWLQGILLVFMLSLSQTSANIQAYLIDNLTNLLGADLVLSQQQALNNSQLAQLNAMSQQVVLTHSLDTTLTHNGQWQSAYVKAVAADYPLQGQLRSSATLHDSETLSSRGPAPGEIWLDSRLFTSLALQMGDPLSIGNSSLIVARILQHEPDRLMQGHSVQMRALVNRQDLPLFNATADMIQHRYLVAANSQQISQILGWQQQQLPAATLYHKLGAHPLALFWQRTENLLGLTSIILFFMAAVAMQQLSRWHMQHEQFFTAVCLSLGASKQSSLQISVYKWLFGLLCMLPLLLVIAALCHALVVYWLSGTFAELKWQLDPALALKTLAATSAMFLLFNLPLWRSLQHASVRQLMHAGSHRLSTSLVFGCALLVLAAVAAYYSDNVRLSAMVLMAMLSSISLLLLLSWLLLSFGEKLSQPFSGLLPFTLYMMKQRLLSKSTQIVGVGLAAFLLLFTLMLLKDLGGSMMAYQRQHDGNLLVSQASAAQMADITSWASRHDIAIRQHKPFIYAKLLTINGIALTETSRNPSDSLATLRQPVRMHWSETVPANNRIVAGQWWHGEDKNWQQVSLEQEVMTDLGLNPGDSLGFFIAGQQVNFRISASHVYKNGAGAITFWLQVPPLALQHIQAPRYSMASLELAPAQFALLTELWQQHPALRMVSLQELTARFDRILAMVTKVISGFALLICLLAAIVIVVSVQAASAEERKKNSIILSFGLNRRTCLQLNILEWLVTGTIAACGAIAGTWVAGELIYQSQFSLPYQPNVSWLLTTLAIILALVTLLGTVVSKHSLSGSVRQLLAE